MHVPCSSVADAVTRWRGGLAIAPGLMTFTGRIGDAAAHAHAAVQVVFVARGSLTLTDASGRSVTTDAAIIPPGIVHQVDAEPGTTGFAAYLDPESVSARAAISRLAELPADQADSWAGAAVPRPSSPVVHAPRARRGHPVIAEALRIASTRTGGPPKLGELAAQVGLSSSRLSHVFTAEVGLPYAAWRRWTRLRLAFDVVRDGGPLTEAAHTAGFADSAHLTRTCRELFGITPTEALIATGRRPGHSGNAEVG